MVKKGKKGAPKPRPKKETGPNLFERLSNKKRFNVLGRNLKGETRHVGKLRTAAVEKRKETLLVEYKQLRKANAFIDRRFGEEDDSLTADERAILRFQKQRMREMAGSKFTLAEEGEGEGQEEQLTHLGRSLAELQGAEEGWGSDEDARLDDEMVRDAHFGGGIFERKRPAAEGDAGGEDGVAGGEDAPERRRSKKEVMEEVMAKSKAYKAQRQAVRQEDVEATDALDAAWHALASSGALAGALRPQGAKPEAAAGGAAAADEDRRFDALTRELLYEGKAQPGERTLAPAELADMERARLEALEAARLKRQRGGGGGGGGDDLEDDFGGGGEEAAPLEGGPAGGYALRRAKRAKKEAEREARAAKAQRGSGSEGSGSDEGSDDDGEEGSSEEEGGSSEEEGAPGLEARRQAAAAGSHPLQQAFRDASARLMSKFNVKPAAAPAGGGSGDSSSDEEEEEGSGPTSDSGESGSDEEDGAAPSGSDSEGEPAGEPEPETRGGGEGAAGRDFSDPGVGALSFTPPLPETYPQFAAMASGLGPQQLSELLRRVRAFHAPALNSGGRKKLQALYGVVAQHFSTLAAARPPALAHLDTLVPHLLELTPVVPFYAATLARARLVRAQAALAQRLRDPLLRAAAWPPARTLLLLKLLATLFPASDRRHPVLTPASLLACAALAQCPLARPRDVGAGLYLASLAMHLHSQARRFVSEPLAFAAAALRLALPARPGDAEAGPRWLCVAGGGPAEALPAAEGDIEPLAVLRVLGEEDDAYFSSPAFKTSAAAAAARLVRRAAHVYADVDALPEILAPAQEALRAIVAAANGGSSKAPKPKAKSRGGAAPAGALVAPGLASLCGAVLAEADAAVAAAAARRRPLCLPSMVALPESRQFNPRFEEGYAAGKDYDPDRDRADRRRLQREVRREERGAMRELRKDTAFMAGVRDRERAGAGAERDKSARRAMAFLQQQEADFKSGGQGGMWKKRSRK